MTKVAIIGNTTWGEALATLLGDKGLMVKVWARSEKEAKELARGKHSYSPTSCIEESLDGAELVIWAVPSQKLRQNVVLARPCLTNAMLLMSAAKGLEVDTGKRMSQVLADEVSPEMRRQICVISGPNLAKEIAQGLPAASVVASRDMEVAEKACRMMECARFRLLPSGDIVGTELCGALKNIVALGAGMMDGLGLGDNAKSAFIVCGWAEIASLGVILGAEASTFYGLAGLGDLITTCAGNLSRNHYVGYELARGRSLSEIRASMAQVAEGIYTAMALHRLTGELEVKLPIADVIHDILFKGLSVGEIEVAFGRLSAADYQPSPGVLNRFVTSEIPHLSG